MKREKCLKCQAYKLTGIELIMEIMGFPGFEFEIAASDVEERAERIFKSLARKKK